MEKKRIKWRTPRPATDAETLLEGYYSQLQKWGALLTRGDLGMAQEIVHELCLHFMLAKPDLSQVTNLDGYLYTCLRNIYLSVLARASREATQFVSVAEFDSIHFALSTSSPDCLLQRQNDLRRICGYTVWRKKSSKSASYLILLFFHGYCRREVAEIACLPIAAIYNKLKRARMEVKSYLEESGKLRIATREVPPEPELRLSLVSSAELFGEFREMILRADDSECLSEEALLLHYRSANPKPISCSLLSHIVSCERCLSLIDRHFQRPTLEDREPPDGFEAPMDRKSDNASATTDKNFKTLMRKVRRQRDRVYEHRPRTLSIAINGKIMAFHDVQSERSTLSSRIEHLEGTSFVEVFTEQQVRLALLPIDERPPEGPNAHAQRVVLSDDRWLELTLSFDGLGMNSEVTYFDPALAVVMVEEQAEDEQPAAARQLHREPHPILSVPARPRSIFTEALQYLRIRMQIPALAWAVVLACILCGSGYFAYRHARAPLDANDLLNQSIRMETAELHGQTEHQLLNFEETAADGHTLRQGNVDVWKDEDNGRYIRRLYDASHRLIAAEWHQRDGESGYYTAANNGDAPEDDRELVANALWKQDVSVRAFRNLAGGEMRARALGDKYELTGVATGDGTLHLLSAVLVLDHHLRPVSELLRLHGDAAIQEARYLLANDERRPNSAVPDSIFHLMETEMRSAGTQANGSAANQHQEAAGVDVRLIQTQIAVLHKLNELNADTGEPIEVTRTSDERILVSGSVAENTRKQEISSALQAMPDHELIDIHLASQHDLRMSLPAFRKMRSPATSVYNIGQAEAPADPILRGYFGSKGWSSDRVNASVAQFSQDALEHARRALQHAYALDRLGRAFSAEELRAISPTSKRQWAEMLARHAAALESELHQLHDQLVPITPAAREFAGVDGVHAPIDTLAVFASTAGELLQQVQTLNRNIGSCFASGATGKANQTSGSLVANAANSIPLRKAAEVSRLASRLALTDNMANGHNNIAGK
jgi:DNA-directed RNA polymerase specialized sigma24 family protein